MRTFISFDQSPVEIDLQSPFLIMADPMALEGLAGLELPSHESATLEDIRRGLAQKPLWFNVYTHFIQSFSPGKFIIAATDIKVTKENQWGRAAAVDSGALVFFDYAARKTFLREFTWRTYDHALQEAGNGRFEAITSKIGERCYGVMFGNADGRGDFKGDGAYRLRNDWPRKRN